MKFLTSLNEALRNIPDLPGKDKWDKEATFFHGTGFVYRLTNRSEVFQPSEDGWGFIPKDSVIEYLNENPENAAQARVGNDAEYVVAVWREPDSPNDFYIKLLNRPNDPEARPSAERALGAARDWIHPGR